jgi:hypothetical protein
MAWASQKQAEWLSDGSGHVPLEPGCTPMPTLNDKQFCCFISLSKRHSGNCRQRSANCQLPPAKVHPFSLAASLKKTQKVRFIILHDAQSQRVFQRGTEKHFENFGTRELQKKKRAKNWQKEVSICASSTMKTRLKKERGFK